MTRRSEATGLRIIPLALAVLLPYVAGAQTFTGTRTDLGGEGGTDYLTADPATGRVFVSRGTHVMVVDGATGKVVGDLANTPRVHGIALVPATKQGFTTNGGDSTVTVFDAATLTERRRVKVPAGGLDGIMYDQATDRVVLTNHSRPKGTVTTIDPRRGDIVAQGELDDLAPEGAASDGRGRYYVNNEETSTMQVLDAATLKPVATWKLAPCDGPTGLAYDAASRRLFVGCGKTSLVVDPADGRIVATIPNGDGVDAIGWDPGEKLLYIPAGRSGTVTVARQETPDRYRVVATVPTVPGAKTIAVDPVRHVAYLFQPEYGPAPAGAPPGPGGRPARGPVKAAWFLAVRH